VSGAKRKRRDAFAVQVSEVGSVRDLERAYKRQTRAAAPLRAGNFEPPGQVYQWPLVGRVASVLNVVSYGTGKESNPVPCFFTFMLGAWRLYR